MTIDKRDDAENFHQIFFNDTPLVDLRAPIEFSKGAFPAAANLPLMTDIERQKIGSCYKKYGQKAAIKLGNELVSGVSREQRLEGWKSFIKDNPQGYLYCFRGGLRSRTVQQWLRDVGVDYPLIKGGYKAMRQYLIQMTEQLANSKKFIIIGGRTGTRKTDLILNHQNSVDLEGRANHRGSSFGRRVGGQPKVISFENNVAIDLLKLNEKHSTLFLEDEGVTIGSCSVPEPLRRQIKTSEIYLVEATLEQRVENILKDYVLTLCKEYELQDPELGYGHYCEAMLSSLARIKKRLGSERYLKLHRLMDKAFNSRESEIHSDYHRDWIRLLLNEYYDPMYDYQLAKKTERVKASGSWQSISELMYKTRAL
ncbi:MAG: tRNA 2-selenouridine(34) synthase MnmH [Gammaproteobacteria bacterium]|nr:MAG: tRNA 2-selenouridine(34) synthase MnmH [Gammaproteobacteria bacterium]